VGEGGRGGGGGGGGELRYSSTLYPHHWMEVGGQCHAPRTLSLDKKTVTHCIGGWVGFGASLDRYGKSSPQWSSNPRPSST